MASSLLTSTACATPTTRSNRQKRASYAAATPSTGTRRFFPVIPTHLAEAGVATHISGPHGNASIAAIWNRTNAGPGSRTRRWPPTRATRKLHGTRNGARQGREKFLHGTSPLCGYLLGFCPVLDCRAVRGSGPPNQHWLVGSRATRPRRAQRAKKDTALTRRGLCPAIEGRALDWLGRSSSEAFFRRSGAFRPRVRSVAVVVQRSRRSPSRRCGREDREDEESTRACVSHAVRNALGRHEQISRAHR